MRPPQGVITTQWRSNGKPSIELPGEAQTMGGRVQPLVAFCHQAASWLQQWGHDHGTFQVQLHDEAPTMPCFRFDAPLTDDRGGPLIPDPYALGTAGFSKVRESFLRQPLPPWEQRIAMAIWRGSSTGSAQLSQGALQHNLRYRLCQLSRRWPELLDARFTAVVQAVNPAAHARIRNQLLAEDCLAPRVQPWHLALHRWLIEIDGNVNSWGLLWKLLSGSCVVRVHSPRQQWYHQKLQPWVHVVPVAADLSDLVDTLIWCQTHPTLCRQIALAGRQLGLEVVAQLEEDQRRAVLQWALQWNQPAPGNRLTGSTGGGPY